MAKFAPDIEIELPSGDILEMTQKEYDSFISKPIDFAKIFIKAPKEKLNFLREEDVKAFVDWTSVVQEKENKPVGANTEQGQQRINEVIGVVDTSLPPEARSLLNALAEAEGGTYTNRFGGGELPDPNKHPMDTVTIKGKTSSAAGRYQINEATWSDITKANKDITDFSPANQDKGAWWLAQLRYRNNTKTKENPKGRDLLTDLQNKKTDLLVPALSGTWDALNVKPLRYEQPQPDAQTPPVGSQGAVEYDLKGKIRTQKLSPTLEANIGKAVGEVYGPGYKARVYSGGQKSNKPGEGTGSIRHNAGMAGDVYIIGPDGNVVQDTKQLDKLKDYWRNNKLGSVGTYMKGGGMHIDEWTEDKLLPGMGLIWDYN